MESSCHELKWNFKLGNLVKHIQRLTKLSDMAFEGRIYMHRRFHNEFLN